MKLSKNYILDFPDSETIMPYGGAYVAKESRSPQKKVDNKDIYFKGPFN